MDIKSGTLKEIFFKIKKRIVNLSSIFLGKRLLGSKTKEIIFVEPTYFIVNKLTNASTILDVGTGNDADFSQDMIRKYNLRSYGFDPTRKHFEPLKQVEKDSGGRFTLYNYAVSGKAGAAEFMESESNISGSFSTDHVNAKRDKIKKYEVTIVTLDDILQMLKLDRVDLVKIDVEGEEYKIIDALKKDVADKIDQLVVEFHHDCIDRYTVLDTWRAIKALRDRGFNYYSLDAVNYLFYK